MNKVLLVVSFLFCSPAFSQVNLTQGLLAYYPLNNNANDVSGNNINGTVNNAVTTTDRFGQPNSAYYFNGTDSYIQLPPSTLFDFSPTEDLSISVWVQPDVNSPMAIQAIVMKSPPNPDFYQSEWNYGIYIIYNNMVTGIHDNVVLIGTTVFSPNQCWYHLTFNYSNGQWFIYVNGKLEGSNIAQTDFITQNSTSNIAFGKKGDAFGDFYKGKMDEVRIYDRMLNQQEIDSLSTQPPACRPACPLQENFITKTNPCKSREVNFETSAALYDSIKWQLGDGSLMRNITTFNYEYLNDGDYDVKLILFRSSCVDTVVQKVSLKTTKVKIIATPDTTICYNAKLQLNSSGAQTYQWSPSNFLDNPTSANPVASPTSNITYYVNARDVNGCPYIDSVKIAIKPQPSFSVSNPSSLCAGKSIQLIASGGNLYQWSPANSLSDPSVRNPIASPASTTAYQVRIIESSCKDTVQLSTTVNILPAPSISAARSNDITCSVPESQLNATGALSYLWTPAEGLSNANSSNPLVTISKTTQFIVKGTNGNGCEAFDSVTVSVSNAGKLPFNVPNAFSPNGDGKNDCFRLRSTGYIENLEFSVFNRWGQRVFYSNDPQACWDGTFKGKKQDSGGFVYIVKGNSLCGFIERKGTFVLIR